MLFDKLRQIEERSQEIARVLADPAIFSQPAEYARLRKEHADTLEVVEKFTEYRDLLKRLGEARHILAEGGDRELVELAQAEIDELSGRQTVLEEDLKKLVLPKDPNDDKNVFVEIRAGAGGDEAALFAADLARMYTKYAEAHRWKVEVMDSIATGVGGVKEVIFFVQGRGAWSRLKVERGVHSVQRVAVTEARGPPLPGGHRRAQRADPHLQFSRGPRDRSPHRAHAAPSAGDPRGRSRRHHRCADGGRAGRAAAEGGVVSAAVDPDTLLEARPTVGTALAAGAA